MRNTNKKALCYLMVLLMVFTLMLFNVLALPEDKAR